MTKNCDNKPSLGKPKMIQILVGLIASGKSTYCKHAAKKGYIIVNDDAIVNAVHGGDYNLYSEDLKPLYKSIENHIIGVAIAMKKHIVIDRSLNVSISGRERFISLAKSFDEPTSAVIFPIELPQLHAMRRYMSDSRERSYEHWLKVANEHLTIYCEPLRNEGFAHVNHITYEEVKAGVVF